MHSNDKKIIIYTVPEIAEMLQITPQTVRNYLNEGRIKGTKAGGKWVVEKEALKEFLRGE